MNPQTRARAATIAIGRTALRLALAASSAVFLLALVSPCPASAQQAGSGTISGRVFDGETGAPIENATVILVFPDPGDGTEPRQEVATSGPSGDYEFGAVPAGRYTLSFIKSGFRASSVTDFEVQPGQDNVADFPMPPAPVAASGEVMELDAFVVEASIVGDMVNNMELRLESDQVVNLLSAEDLAKYAASDVADAIKRVAGVNVVEGQFAIIRGLEDRYSSTLYNGAPIPSPDPESQSVQLDLFPSDIVGNLEVAKTFEASSPSNSAGGTIDIITHDYPDEFTFKFTAGTGFNERALDEFLRYQSNSPVGVSVDADHVIESDISGSLGGRFDLFEREMRFKIVVAQEIDFDTANGKQEGREPMAPVSRRGLVLQTGDLSLGKLGLTAGRFDLTTSVRSEQDTYYGGLGFDLDREGKHRLDGSIFYTKKQNEVVQRLENGYFPGFDYGSLSADQFLQQGAFTGTATNLAWLNNYREEPGAVNRGALSFVPRYQSQSVDLVRELTVYQLNGDHDLDFIEGLTLGWVASYAQTKQTETAIRARYWFEPDDVPEPLPDSFIPSVFPPQVSDFGPGTYVGVTSGTTPFLSNKINENQYFFRADLGYQFEPMNDVEVDLGAGFWFEQANRDVNAKTDTTESGRAGLPGVVGDGSTAYVQGSTPDELGRFLYRGIGLDEPQNRSTSTGKREIVAWDLEAKISLFEDLDVVAGARFENLRIQSNNSPYNGACSDGSQAVDGPNGNCPADTLPLIFPGRYIFIDRLDNPENPFFAESIQPPPFNDQILGLDLRENAQGIVDVLSREDIEEVVNGEIDEFKVLPAVAVAYRPLAGLSLRGAYSQTMARPSFREMGFYTTLGTGNSDFTVGNPQLDVSDVESFDTRLEYVWGDLGDLASFSFFYKTIDHPIEAITIRNPTDLDNLFRTFRNNENEASLWGIELEARKNFGFLGEFFEYLSLGGNYTYIDAKVERSSFERDQASQFFGATQADIDAGKVRFNGLSRNRRLFNQPEWIANADVSFDHPDWGTRATLSIFAISEVLDAAGSGNILPNGLLNSLTLDRYVDKFYQLDLVVSQSFEIPRLPGEWTVKTSIKNLTDTTRKIIYDQQQTSDDIRERSFKVGRDYTFALGYQISF